MEFVEITINSKLYNLQIEKDWTLMYLLREVLDMTGTKCGCNTNDCGACRVIIDGEAKNSCCILVRNINGSNIITIEGIANGSQLHPIQRAFIEAGAVQCGFCTPGMIISTKALLDKNINPTETEIREALKYNLCRCTGYVKIVEAVQLAAKWLREEN